MNPLVSVIIPVYNNAPAFVRAAVESALRQTYPHLEVMVVDDGSTVDMRWLAEAYHGRLTYLRKANGGPASARNLGIRQSKGEFIALLDADDLWETDKVEEQVRVLQQHPETALVYSAVTRINEAGESMMSAAATRPGPSGRIAGALFMKNFIPTSTVMVRRACVKALGLFDEAPELISVEDYDLWLRIAERYDVASVDRPLTKYRMHAGGISRNVARSYRGERLVLERAIARRGQPQPALTRSYRKRFARLHAECGYEYFALGQQGEARRQFLMSLRHAPWSVRNWIYVLATFLRPSAVAAARTVKRRVVPQRPAGRLRILHVLFSLDTGGAEHVVLNLARRTDRQRYELHVCGFSGQGELETEFRQLGVRMHPLRKRPGIDARLPFTLAALIRRERIDLVHTHNVTPWLYAGIGARLAGVPLYHTEHSNLFPHQRALMRAERWLAGWTRAIIADSDKVRRQLVERQGIPAAKVRMIANGIDTEVFGRAIDANEKRHALGLNGAAPIIGTVGRLAPVKDQATLLAAFARIIGTYPTALLVLVGDGPMRQALERQAETLGIAPRVVFLGRRTDTPALLPLFDVFVLSSVSEGLPLTILEAMAAGTPVVSTNVGGIPEVVLDGETGLLVPPGDPGRLADAIAGLCADAGMRSAFGRRAKQRVRAQFDLNQMVRAYETAYRD